MTTKNDYKHLTKITSSKLTSVRPTLQAIHYNKQSNMIEACDSHRLLRISSEKPIEYDFSINPKTMQVFDGQYPNLERLIPNNWIGFLSNNRITKEFVNKVKVYKKETITFSVTKNILSLSKDGNTFVTLSLVDLQDCEFLINGQYLLDLFEYLLDSDSQDISVHFISNIRPILFCSDDFQYLVTPIRPKN